MSEEQSTLSSIPMQIEEAPTIELISADQPEDPSLNSGLILQRMEDTTEQAIMKSIRDVFHGFNFDASDNFSNKFANVEQLADYVATTHDDVLEMRKRMETTTRLQSAAAMARLWCMTVTMDKALTEAKYGNAAYQQIAARMQRSVSLVYQLRKIGQRLTLTECYLLGMRDIPSSILRSLADIPDQTTMHSIVRAYINDAVDSSDTVHMAKAKKAFVAAINMAKGGVPLALTTSDATVEGATSIMVSPEYQAVMQELQKWQKMLKKPSLEQTITDTCKVMADFFISEHTPEAEEHLEEVKEACKQTRVVLQAVKSNIEDLLHELDSIEASEVLKDDPTDEPESDQQD